MALWGEKGNGRKGAADKELDSLVFLGFQMLLFLFQLFNYVKLSSSFISELRPVLPSSDESTLQKAFYRMSWCTRRTFHKVYINPVGQTERETFPLDPNDNAVV